MKKTNNHYVLYVILVVILVVTGKLLIFPDTPANSGLNNQGNAENVFANFSSKPKRGAVAPEFTLKDLTGRDVTISSLKGKPLLINFWSINCPPCREEMPLLEEASITKSSDVIVIGVNLGDSQGDIESFVKTNKITFMVLQDSDGKVAELYNVIAFPVSYFVDENGILQGFHTGQLSESTLKENLKKIGIDPW